MRVRIQEPTSPRTRAQARAGCSTYREGHTSIPLGTRSIAYACLSPDGPGHSSSANATREGAGTLPSGRCIQRTASCIACSSNFGGIAADLLTFWWALMAAPTMTSDVATGNVAFTAPDVSCRIVSTVRIVFCPKRSQTRNIFGTQGVSWSGVIPC